MSLEVGVISGAQDKESFKEKETKLHYIVLTLKSRYTVDCVIIGTSVPLHVSKNLGVILSEKQSGM